MSFSAHPIIVQVVLDHERMLGRFRHDSAAYAKYGPAGLDDERFAEYQATKRRLPEIVHKAAQEIFGPDLDRSHTCTVQREIWRVWDILY